MTMHSLLSQYGAALDKERVYQQGFANRAHTNRVNLSIVFATFPLIFQPPKMTSIAQRCAELHNTLVSRVPCPIFHLRRNLVTFLQTQQPETCNDLQDTQLL